jgi:hypothetical protein
MYAAGMLDFCCCTSITQEFGALEPWKTQLHHLLVQKLQLHTLFAIKVPISCRLMTLSLYPIA